jgi:tetratricopeptide (TPR) repeat protein
MNALAYFDRAVLESNKNDFTNALADFDKVLLLNPKNIQALFNRAKIKSQTKDYKGALDDYTATIDLYPYMVEAYYERGRLKEVMKDFEGAKADYRSGKIMDELTGVSNTFQRANDSVKLMRLIALNANFNSGNQNLPDTTTIDLIPLYYLAIKSSSGNYRDVRSDCIPMLFKKSKKEYLHFCLTNKMAVAEDTSKESSRDILNETIIDTGKQMDILLQKAVKKTDLQLYHAAANDYDKIIAHDTASAIAYFARGIDICKETEMLGQLNGNEQAMYINKTYRIVNDPATVQYKKAIADFTKVTELEPDFAYAYYNRAYVKYKMHDLNGAVDDYNYALQIDPGFADTYYNRGLLLFLLNAKVDACEDFSKAGELGLTQAYLIIKIYCSQVTK